LLADVTGGDPMSGDLYCRRSLRTLRDELAGLGHAASPNTVADLLRDLDFRLRVNVKRLTGPAHPDRDQQFRYIDQMRDEFAAADLPIISVDTKKKELVGQFANGGQAWVDEPIEVNAHDFLTDARCRAVPYGIYDVLANRGHVVVGQSADTAEFAVEAIAAWWRRYGCQRYRGAGELLILADSGGSNGCRPRLWKARLQAVLADRYGLDVTVCHYPRGASKWNPVEHRLFGPISNNWAGIPLASAEVVLGYIRGTTTATGLRVSAEWTAKKYVTRVKVTQQEMNSLQIERHNICPQWNYTITPRTQQPTEDRPHAETWK
jgi:DDE family transposase